MSSGKKDEEMICGLTADERDLLQQELRRLPDVMTRCGSIATPKPWNFLAAVCGNLEASFVRM